MIFGPVGLGSWPLCFSKVILVLILIADSRSAIISIGTGVGVTDSLIGLVGEGFDWGWCGSYGFFDWLDLSHTPVGVRFRRSES